MIKYEIEELYKKKTVQKKTAVEEDLLFLKVQKLKTDRVSIYGGKKFVRKRKISNERLFKINLSNVFMLIISSYMVFQ